MFPTPDFGGSILNMNTVSNIIKIDDYQLGDIAC